MQHSAQPHDVVFYGEDLAAIHAAAFEGLAEHAARDVISLLGTAPAQVLDLGCGPGALSAALAGAGHAVWACDLSPAFLEIARRRVPAAEFHCADLLEVALPTVRAIAAVGEVLNYATARAPGEAALAAFFARCYDALAPGGLLLFDMATFERGRGAHQSWRDGEGWHVAVTNVRQDDAMLLRHIVSFRRQPDGRWRRAEERHALRLWSQPTVIALLEAAGFHVTVAPRYGELTLPPGLVVFQSVRAG